MGTKERILETAIDLFAAKGYNDVSIREITRAVGIKESSLYNHFAGKQQIFDDILDDMARRLNAVTPSEEEAARLIGEMTLEQFLDLGSANLRLYFGNPVLVKVWRILAQERYHNEKAAAMYQKYLLDDPIDYQARVFALMMEREQMRPMDPGLLAREFYGALLYLFHRYIELDATGTAADDPALHRMVREHLLFLAGATAPAAQNG